MHDVADSQCNEIVSSSRELLTSYIFFTVLFLEAVKKFGSMVDYTHKSDALETESMNPSIECKWHSNNNLQLCLIHSVCEYG